MKLHPLDIVLWIVPCIAEAAVVFVLLKKGSWRRWPFLLALICFDLLHAALSAYVFNVYKHYFYVYWYGTGIRSLLSLGLLYDVFRSMPALKFVPRQVGLMLASAGATVTIGSMLLASGHHAKTYPVMAVVLMIHESVTVLWVACALSLLGSISFLGLGWSRESVNITAGFLVSGIAEMLRAHLASSWPEYGQMFGSIQTCIDIAVFCSWIKIFSGQLPATIRLQPLEEL